MLRLLTNPLITNSGRSRLNIVRYKSAYECEGKSTATILNNEVDLGLMIDCVSTAGFRLNNGLTVLGSIALFHRSILSWTVSSARRINPESLTLFKIIDPKPDFLVIGVGDNEELKYGNEVIKACKAMNLNADVFATEQACSTFNFLNAEGRNIAALLIPPVFIEMREKDVMESRINRYRMSQYDPI